MHFQILIGNKFVHDGKIKVKKTNTYDIRQAWDMMYIAFDRQTVEGGKMSSVPIDGGVGHSFDLVRRQVQPDWNLTLSFCSFCGQQVDPTKHVLRVLGG